MLTVLKCLNLAVILANLVLSSSTGQTLSSNGYGNEVVGANILSRRRHRKRTGHYRAPSGDYLMLSQGWKLWYDQKIHPPRVDLHGLWPNFADGTWPQFCDDSQHGRGHDFSICNLNPHAFKCSGGREGFDCSAILKDQPHYCGRGREFVANHEYAKHGTCMGLTDRQYFAEIDRVLRLLPSAVTADGSNKTLYGTPQILHDNAGKHILAADLKEVYMEHLGGVDGSFIHTCTRQCHLQNIFTCYRPERVEKGGITSYSTGKATPCSPSVQSKRCRCEKLFVSD